jgi:hypothetical protein
MKRKKATGHLLELKLALTNEGWETILVRKSLNNNGIKKTRIIEIRHFSIFFLLKHHLISYDSQCYFSAFLYFFLISGNYRHTRIL